MKILGLIGINLLVLAALVTIMELLLGDLFEDRLRVRNYTCSDELVHHQYCPGIVHRRFMASADGGGAIDTYVNGASLAVPIRRSMEIPTDLHEFNLVNIGRQLHAG